MAATMHRARLRHLSKGAALLLVAALLLLAACDPKKSPPPPKPETRPVATVPAG